MSSNSPTAKTRKGNSGNFKPGFDPRRRGFPHAANVEGDRPNCPRCFRPMYRAGKGHGRQRWGCKTCRFITIRPESMPDVRPVCPTHGRHMQRQKREGRTPWRCPLPHPKVTHGRATCQRCALPLRKAGFAKGRQRWCCPSCDYTTWADTPAEPRTLTDDEATELLKLITVRLPAHLPPDVREEARQSLMLAVLEGQAALDPDRKTVRHHASAARGMSWNRFRYLPLDAPIPGTDGLTWAETLIG